MIFLSWWKAENHSVCAGNPLHIVQRMMPYQLTTAFRRNFTFLILEVNTFPSNAS